MRIVSLIASATEIVCALGLREHLVGVSHECDYPADVKGLPVLSEPKVDPRAPSAAIDASVRDIARQGLSVYRVRTDLLEALQPDLIVTQDQCEVCAVSLQDVTEAVRSLTRRDTKICTLRPNVLDDIPRDFLAVAEAAGVPERGAALVASFRDRLEAVRSSVPGNGEPPRVACVEWLEPCMIAGGWMPALVRIAGGEPVIVTDEEHFRTVTWDDVAQADPDVVVVMPCGFPVEQSLAELRRHDPLRGLRARCCVVDGNAWFNRPGPRIADSAEILARVIRTGEGGVPWPA